MINSRRSSSFVGNLSRDGPDSSPQTSLRALMSLARAAVRKRSIATAGESAPAGPELTGTERQATVRTSNRVSRLTRNSEAKGLSRNLMDARESQQARAMKHPSFTAAAQ